MTWYRRFKNRKCTPYYEINSLELEKVVQDYFSECYLDRRCRTIEYKFSESKLILKRRTVYEFACEEIESLYYTISSLKNYYIDIDYIHMELEWLQKLIPQSDRIIHTIDWILYSDRPVYSFLKHFNVFRKNFFINWEDGEIFSGFPSDLNFGEIYYNPYFVIDSPEIKKVVSGSEKRSKLWEKYVGFSKHRILGHQFGVTTNNKLSPLNHPYFLANK